MSQTDTSDDQRCPNEEEYAGEAGCKFGGGNHGLCLTHATCESVLKHIQELEQQVARLTEQNAALREMLKGSMRIPAIIGTKDRWTDANIDAELKRRKAGGA